MMGAGGAAAAASLLATTFDCTFGGRRPAVRGRSGRRSMPSSCCCCCCCSGKACSCSSSASRRAPSSSRAAPSRSCGSGCDNSGCSTDDSIRPQPMRHSWTLRTSMPLGIARNRSCFRASQLACKSQGSIWASLMASTSLAIARMSSRCACSSSSLQPARLPPIARGESSKASSGISKPCACATTCRCSSSWRIWSTRAVRASSKHRRWCNK
mmetsp:Transcript_59641/g.153607  ORF Transcript_59641/g.153607 Transcript_59641/m.153607 type:complete len:212 (+) Transcript_59641:471-1106(+)